MWIPLHRQPNFAARKKQKVEDDGASNFFLNKPNTKKLHRENVHLVNNTIEVGHSSMQGYRTHMEDERIISKMTVLHDHVLVAIMDGNA